MITDLEIEAMIADLDRGRFGSGLKANNEKYPFCCMKRSA